MPFRIGRALIFAVIIWVISFVWGSIVFMSPSLKRLSSIPYVSSNPAISLPILAIWLVVTYLLAKSFLKASDDTVAEGRMLDFVFSIVTVGLDLLILVFLLKTGFGFFISLSVWVGYLMLLAIPWLVGRSLRRQTV